MGFWDFLKPKPGKDKQSTPARPSHPPVSPSVPRLPAKPKYDKWVDPPVTPPTAEWERRLNVYARKCARQLSENGVPLFRSKWPRDGKHTFKDEFWLIACDVDAGERQWVAVDRRDISSNPPGHPLLPRRGEYVGTFRGDALLLTKSGVLCVARAEGFITRAGGVDDREMDMLFEDVVRPILLFRSYDWGWSNRGSWRSSPRSDLRPELIHTIKFERRDYRKTSAPVNGRDTSATLTHFVRSGGKTRWPRGFVSFKY